MSILINNEPQAYDLKFNDEEMIVYLKDGRKIIIPLIWYPTLYNADKKQLLNYEFIGDGEGIHWIDLDEDLSINGFLKGIKNNGANYEI